MQLLSAYKALNKPKVDSGLLPTKYLQFTICDSGRGMSQEFVANNLFKPFTQEDPLSRKYTREGTGLGLWISKKMIESLNGFLKVTSALGKGTAFSFEIKVDMILDKNSKDQVDEFCKDINSLPVRPSCLILYQQGQKNLAEALCRWLKDYSFTVMAKDISSGENLATTLQSCLVPFIFILSSTHYLFNIISSPVLSSTCEVLFVCSIGDIDALERELNSMKTFNGKVTWLTQPVGPLKIHQLLSWSLSRAHTPKLTPNLVPVATQRSCVLLSTKTPNPFGIQALLVDDNPTILMFLGKVMEVINIPAKKASNGKLAVDMFKESGSSFELVIIDLHMPVMGGLEAVSHIRRHEQEVESTRRSIIFLLSAVTPSDLAKEDQQATSQVDEFLTKPVSKKTILDCVVKYFKGPTMPMS
jgi:CheY-like chemotaxis protein